jgi:hypothetical protein
VLVTAPSATTFLSAKVLKAAHRISSTTTIPTSRVRVPTTRSAG